MPGMVPKCDIKHPKWPTAILNMHNMDMEWKYGSKAAPRQAFSSLKHGQATSIDRATMACKSRGQERGIEVDGKCKAQMEKYPSTTLNRD